MQPEGSVKSISPLSPALGIGVHACRMVRQAQPLLPDETKYSRGAIMK